MSHNQQGQGQSCSPAGRPQPSPQPGPQQPAEASTSQPQRGMFDCFSPAEIAARVETIGVTKAHMNRVSIFVLAMLAGAFVALGSNGFTMALTGAPPIGLPRLAAGVIFSVALILIVIGGAELFTGNTLLTMAYVSRKIRTIDILRNWLIVFLGNFVGSLGTVAIVYSSHQQNYLDGQVGETMVKIAAFKLALGFWPAFFSGILCNALVCLAVWLCSGCRSVTDKILAIVLPIVVFTAGGFEHCVANMYFVPLGILVDAGSTPGLNWWSFLADNLLPVTLGNIVGGGLLVGAVYWFIYLRKAPAQ